MIQGMKVGRDRLPGPERRDMEEEILLGNVDVDDLSRRYDAARLLVVRTIRDLTGAGGDPLGRWSAMCTQARHLLAQGVTPDDKALGQAHGFPPFVVAREVAHIKAQASQPEPSAPEAATPAETVVASDPFADVGPVWLRGDHADVVFAHSTGGSRRPALEYLSGMFATGGAHRQRAIEFQENVFRFATTGWVPRDNLEKFKRTRLLAFRVFKHRLYCRLVTVEDAASGQRRRMLVLLSAHEKKQDRTPREETDRAHAIYEAWAARMEGQGHGLSSNPEEPDPLQAIRDGAPDLVESATVRLMQDLQAIVRDAMRREGMNEETLARSMGVTREDVEQILWDTTTPLARLVQAAVAAGISLGGREAE